jgi:hypothetical protein
LRVIESQIPVDSQLLISFVKTKVKDDKIVDSDTLQQVKKLINSLVRTIDEKNETQ